MKITFVSNYMNHHQYPFCRELMKYENVEFKFIATLPIRKERLELGYRDMNQEPFVIRAYESLENERMAEDVCRNSDVVITGSAPEKYAGISLEENRLLFRYSERLFKNGMIHSFSPKARINIWKNHGRYKNKRVYLLCAGAYVASDFNLMCAYKNKTYKWGYFPEVEIIDDIGKVCEEKEPGSILWVGRYLDWKHPEVPVEIGKRLKEEGIPFRIRMIGTGEIFSEITKKIHEEKLTDYIEQLGAMSSEMVREYMKKSEIFIFSSDFREGWGGVLNEAMNSGCAVVASHAIGSVPYLIKNQDNGLIYKNGKTDELYQQIEQLLGDFRFRRRIQKNAYETIVNEWNPKIAAERFIVLVQTLLNEKECEMFEYGPCSKG